MKGKIWGLNSSTIKGYKSFNIDKFDLRKTCYKFIYFKKS